MKNSVEITICPQKKQSPQNAQIFIKSTFCERNLCQSHTPATPGTRVRHCHVMQTLTSSLQIYKILFSIHFLYRYDGGKCKHTNTGIFFREVPCTRYDVSLFTKEMNYSDCLIYRHILVTSTVYSTTEHTALSMRK